MIVQSRRGVLVGCVLVSLLSLCALSAPSAAAATVPPGTADGLVASGLTSPTALAVANDGRVFVAEQGGAIRVIKGGALLPTPFTQLTVKSGVGAASEEGLLGIALDPSFATNNRLYAYYTVPASGSVASHNRLSRFTANGDVALAGSQKILLDVPGPSSSVDNGGPIRFGVDGKLYVAVGDHGVGANAQSLSTIKGKLLRMNIDGTTPSDNPFPNATSLNRKIWASGLRNPSAVAVQPGTGKVLVNDVGSGAWEEINLGAAGANYGWDVTEGPTILPGFQSPLFSYAHQGLPGTACGIGGGAFYNPTTAQFPAYVGQYFFGDSCAGSIRVLDPVSKTASDFATGAGQPVDLQVGNDGVLYYLDRSTGSVRRITSAPVATGPSITTHPASVTVAVGQAASFSVIAQGTQPLSFQWQRDNVDIPTATAATYTLPAAALSDNGALFHVVVTNALGTATSNDATLTVSPGGGAATFSDTFNRGDSSDLGSGWLEVRGDLSISGSELRSAPTPNLFQMAVVPSFSSANQTVAASFARVDSNSTPRFGVVLRYQDAQNYYLVARRTGGSSIVQISKVVGGVETVLATKSLPNPVLNTLFRLVGQADAGTLTLSIDGVQMLTVSDSTFAAGNVGIAFGSMSTSTGVGQRADDFAASGTDGTAVPTLTLTAAPTNVAPDGSSTLTWSTTGVDACSFTAGLSGSRAVNGSESTGALTSTTNFAMTCSGTGGSVSKSVAVTVGTTGGGGPPAVLPTATEVFQSETMNLPTSVRAFVVLVPNESHHQDVTRSISPKNGYLLPMKAAVPAGATVSVISGDNGHNHTLTMRSGTTQVFTTGVLAYGGLSAPATLGTGSYSLIDTVYPWIHGDITIGDVPTDGTLLVGAFFVPANHLTTYTALYVANGFQIESQYAFSYGGGQQVLVVFSTNQDLSVAGPKLQALAKANYYG